MAEKREKLAHSHTSTRYSTVHGIESQFLVFARCGHKVPPRTAELLDLVVQAARGEHEERRALDERLPKSCAGMLGTHGSGTAITTAGRQEKPSGFP